MNKPKERLLYTNLHHVMNVQGISDEQLALACRKGTAAVRNWKWGKNKPFPKDRVFIAGYLNMPDKKDWLFEFKKEKK